MSMRSFDSVARWVFAILVAGVSAAAAQSPTATAAPRPGAQFRVAVNYVEIDAVVLDAEGRFVRDLGPGDFEVLEDGRRRDLTTLRLVDLPVGRPVSPGPPNGVGPSSDTVTNDRIGDARLYVMVLDDLHTQPERSTRVRDLAGRFISGYLQPGDVMAIVTTGSASHADRDFTSDPHVLLQAVDTFAGSKPPSGSVTLAEGGCFRL
jgi:VWFA-related protein